MLHIGSSGRNLEMYIVHTYKMCFHMMMSLLSIAAALIALKSSSILKENEFPGMAIPPGMNFVDV